jgi:enoyl-CoA hydratase/carnithine racemase
MRMTETLLCERRGELALLTLNRPAQRNAVDFALMDALERELAALNTEPAVRALVLTGAGEEAFSAGMDLKVAQGFDAGRAAAWMRRVRQLFGAIRALDKPLVAAVNGVAAGLGYQIALLADLRVGHEQARMGQTEINVGLASIIGAHLMGLTLGHSRTVELTLNGRLMDGAECLRLGLFHALVAPGEVVDTALAMARSLGAKPPTAMRLTKQRFREATQAGFDAAFEAGARLQAEAYASGEPQAAMAAFLAKRG